MSAKWATSTSTARRECDHQHDLPGRPEHPGDDDLPIAQLSKGNQQKLALAQALGFAAELTVLDEPFSGLDEPAADELRALLAQARSDGRSVLVSAHHPEALALGDDFYRLEDGQLRVVAPSGRNAAAGRAQDRWRAGDGRG